MAGQPKRAAWNAPGVTPIVLLNVATKCDDVANPAASATSATDFPGFFSSVIPRSSLRRTAIADAA